METVTRKLQRTGNATTIAIPKQWLDANGLDAHSEIEFTELADGSLNIKPYVVREKRRADLKARIHGDHDLMEALKNV
ncbi:AbrB/MazE/SpoVT family DNA-binding domain-containing protein [Periweissella cryptocerci]|uniref:AbrB/MazE/SpoVT family DNA-binding domain-containing protein n=1 Tax=Periweissella cryptocerci TaxID=2506420 RepID=A0A4P6YWD9_9LACO|nr:AbrB/MazE/SpoVT family DNA-binding domain-containing protein [Periweissella cryptocerci]QBO37067.1 AbrB/MazE/SpoVT family DNA-binding domain-containing protein [Periweissella cryptocerci]